MASSVCKSLQSLISALTQGDGGGHLFRLTCSLCCREGGPCRQTPLACVRSACSAVSGPLWVCPAHGCALSQSTLLRLQVALQGNCPKQALGCVHFPGLSRSGSGSRVLHTGADSVGPASCALPRPKQFRRPGAWRAHTPQVGSASYHLLVPATRFPGCVA